MFHCENIRPSAYFASETTDRISIKFGSGDHIEIVKRILLWP
jgi:hypothetical protein